nr:helix-turn-helix transcriptional regulator [Polynucleobacter sp. CS-Odin-A6]
MPKIVGECFKDAREKMGLSVEELANKAILSNSQIRQIESTGLSAFYSPTIKYSSAKKVANILGLSEDQAFNINESDLNQSASELSEQKELKEIEAVLAKKMINELQYEKPSLLLKITGKQNSTQLPIQGIEVPQPKRSKKIFKISGLLLVLIAGVGCFYFFLNPLINFS